MSKSPMVLPVASLILGASAGILGGVGSALAVTATGSGSGLTDNAEMLLVVAPAVLAGLLALAGALTGLIGLLRRDAAVAQRVLAGLGLLVSVVVAAAALGWLFFIGGLATLAAFAWH